MDLLAEGARALGLSLNDAQCETLLDFLRRLQRWNKAYNLTAITAFDQMITHHLLDSLSVSRFLSSGIVLDVGSGAGFPGIPLAVCHPEMQFVLLDSVGKKVRFLQQATYHLKLANVTCEQARMESFKTAPCFDRIVCRALGEMPSIVKATRHLLNEGGKWLFMKGVLPESELSELSLPYALHHLTVPGLDAERHLVEVSLL